MIVSLSFSSELGLFFSAWNPGYLFIRVTLGLGLGVQSFLALLLFC